ncbi:iron-containing alcohol dehydrogenase family protein [Haladaptatus sp. ZSTT2]|uniref:iron-containing alcohol dehydrogenase family protein n=1 Tax=Haladaptatus sp. ZSTT2 TaxID=3120515 RepID=UPI00300F6D4C
MIFDHEYERARFVWGPNSVSQLTERIDADAKVMVVCGEHVGATDAVMEPVTEALGEHLVATYTGARPNVPHETVVEGVERLHDCGADALVSIGGGSASDTAKAIAIFAAEETDDLKQLKTRTVDGQVEVPDLPAPKLPLYCVVTTLSAAEVTNICGVSTPEEKVVLLDEKVRPQASIYDPAIAETTPESVIGSTGMNALDHAVEILYSEGRSDNPFYQATAEKAIRLLTENLPGAVAGDPEARVQAQLGAALSGLGVVGGVSINHGVNHILCARHPVSHGDGNSILLPHGIRFTAPAAPDAIRRIGQAMGVDVAGTEEEILDNVLDAVTTLQETLGTPTRLRDVGVEKADFDAIAEIAAAEPSLASHPRDITEADLVAFLEAAW